MVRTTEIVEKPHNLTSPPLFVTAYSKNDGRRHEGLLECDRPPPDWLAGCLHLRVSAPSGSFKDIQVSSDSHDAGYESCLRSIGADLVWTPRLKGVTETLPDLEVWARDGAEIEIHDQGSILAIETGHIAVDERPRFYAVVRDGAGHDAYVANGGRIYLDVSTSGSRSRIVPRALLNTGLAGAFWGFNDRGNTAASFLVAERLLSSLLGHNAPAGPPDTMGVVAAAHAVLIHRAFLPEYGLPVLEALRSLGAVAADAALLEAFLGMARLSIEAIDKAEVVDDVRTALRVTASHRPAFGETLRILNAHFSVLSEVAKSANTGPNLDDEIAAVDAMLHACYVGGQSATYVGDPASDLGSRWRYVVAVKKKTSKS